MGRQVKYVLEEGNKSQRKKKYRGEKQTLFKQSDLKNVH